MKRVELRRGKSPRLDRRSFLAGTGVSLSLPLLEAMLPIGKTAFADSVGSPARMLTFFTGNGVHMQTFTPQKTGSDYVLPETLQPLKALKDDLLILTGLENLPGAPRVANHAPAAGAILTCMPARESATDVFVGVSMDQIAAKKLGRASKFPSLALGLDPGGKTSAVCDNGFSCTYVRNISWSTPTTPSPKISDPRKAFDKLFGDGAGSGGVNPHLEQLAKLDKSVIDAVIEDVNILESKLGINDREKLQGYLTSIRELESQLQTKPSSACGSSLIRPSEDRLSIPEKSRIMNDIMVMAFQCDLTRIITYMFSNSLGGRRYSNLGLKRGHHSIATHGNNQSNYDMLKKIDKYHMEELADLLVKLKQVNDIQGKSLLDSCVVHYTSEMSDGNRHNVSNLPVFLAGGCNGYFKTGRHVKYENKPPLANLYISMLDAMGVQVDTFGQNGTAKLRGLT